jgi:NAD+ dependent glucose-6-phosphate dehydrogenase
VSPRVVLVGGSGVVGRVLVDHLRASCQLLVVDPVAPASGDVPWLEARADEVPSTTLRPRDLVVFLATGAADGWEGLLRTEIVGLRHVAGVAADVAVARFVLASSNHAVGGHELDLIDRGYEGGSDDDGLVSEVRPDSEYGVAKAFGEAYLRYLAEERRLAVSVLRIGTVRAVDDPDEAVRRGEADFLPLIDEQRRRRFRASWLSHPDLVRIVDEEFAATSWFRRRFAVSDNPGRFWPLTVEEWDGR